MDLSADHILVVFLLTTLAGLATGIGGFIAFFMKRTDTKTLTFSLGFSGGVVYISWWNCWGEAQRPADGIRRPHGRRMDCNCSSSEALPWRP
ncbi:MAG: hypothetical protein ACLT8E_01855 [Akkermansia sp.]